MKARQLVVATIWVLSIMMMTGGAPVHPIQAQGRAQPACSLAALRGSYEFVAPATVYISPGSVIAIPEHLLYASPAGNASKGMLNFAGTDRIIVSAIENFGGPQSSPVAYDGDYVVNRDCTIAATFAGDVGLALKMVDNGNTQTLVSTTPGFVILRPLQNSAQ
jgi:hypothetical protein